MFAMHEAHTTLEECQEICMILCNLILLHGRYYKYSIHVSDTHYTVEVLGWSTEGSTLTTVAM